MAEGYEIEPIGDRVVVEPLEDEEEVQGGIVIPDIAKEKPMKGRVVAVGPGRVTEAGDTVPMRLEEGDVVLYGKYSGTEVQVGATLLLVLHESDILIRMAS